MNCYDATHLRAVCGSFTRLPKAPVPLRTTMILTYNNERQRFSWCNVIEAASRTGRPGTSDPQTGPRLDKIRARVARAQGRERRFSRLETRSPYAPATGLGSKTTVGNCGHFWVSRIKSTPKKQENALNTMLRFSEARRCARSSASNRPRIGEARPRRLVLPPMRFSWRSVRSFRELRLYSGAFFLRS